MESNDSPEIPDRGGGERERERDIRHPRPPLGHRKEKINERSYMSKGSKRFVDKKKYNSAPLPRNWSMKACIVTDVLTSPLQKLGACSLLP